VFGVCSKRRHDGFVTHTANDEHEGDRWIDRLILDTARVNGDEMVMVGMVDERWVSSVWATTARPVKCGYTSDLIGLDWSWIHGFTPEGRKSQIQLQIY
jgi:hypothetical protein